MSNDPLLDTCTTREAAVLLGVSLRTAQIWVEEGALRAWKTPGGHRRIIRSSVDDLLRSRGAVFPKQKYEILAVEDEPILRRLYEAKLGGVADARLRVAENGYEGLMRIGEHRPDLLITDLMMPGMDGFELLRRVRGEMCLPAQRLPAIAVTGWDSAEDRAMALRCGYQAHLPKPCEAEQLVATSIRLVSRSACALS